MKVLEINLYDFFSTGNIMIQIAETGRKRGYDIYTAAKRTITSEKKNIRFKHYLIGSKVEHFINRKISTIFDLQECGSIISTLFFIRHIKKIDPDIIHIHDFVGYYLNLKIFFKFLKKYNKPVVWTFHCCWAYTGRCIYYDYINCNNWKIDCKNCCQNKNNFPNYQLFNLSNHNYNIKKKLFLDIPKLHIVTPSYWLQNEVEQSFFKNHNIKTIHNGINLNDFYPDSSMQLRNKFKIFDKKIILGVAAVWSDRKGLKTFIELSSLLPEEYKIVIIGLTKEQINKLPSSILGLPKTFNIKELRNWYTEANIFVNPTLEEVLGLVNIEAQACGTPVITYNTGGSIECVSNKTGIIIEKNDLTNLKNTIIDVCNKNIQFLKEDCMHNASKFDKDLKYNEYIDLYENIYKNERG